MLCGTARSEMEFEGGSSTKQRAFPEPDWGMETRHVWWKAPQHFNWDISLKGKIISATWPCFLITFPPRNWNQYTKGTKIKFKIFQKQYRTLKGFMQEKKEKNEAYKKPPITTGWLFLKFRQWKLNSRKTEVCFQVGTAGGDISWVSTSDTMLFAGGMSNRAQTSKETLFQGYEIQLLQQTAFLPQEKSPWQVRKLHEVQLNSVDCLGCLKNCFG